MELQTNTNTEESWEHFWRGSDAAIAYARDGRSHPQLDEAWLLFFQGVAPVQASPLRVLDLAAGSGVMIGYFVQAIGQASVQVHCLDTSASAIASIEQRYPGVTGHIGDARDTGLPSGAFDIVTSQFGIEYAGEQAFVEAMRLVKPGGTIGLVMHCKGGQIEREGRQSFEAVKRVLKSGLMEHATKAFASGFAYQASGQGLSRYHQASDGLKKSMETVAKVMVDFGPAIANHTVARLLDDIRAMAKQLRGYDRAETLQWLSGMTAELKSYLGRMDALCRAALGDDDVEQIRNQLLERHFVLIRADQIVAAGVPIAWCLQARKAL
jgi:ubiquinone/menaquinone biosynthesis C-methylase UbiE